MKLVHSKSIMLFDVIVCGGGVQGLWTAKYLTEQNQKVLLLEQFPLPHTRGSSHGASRITRYSYATKHHAQMMPESFKRWSELEAEQKHQLFVKCGLLTVSNDHVLAEVTDTLDSLNIPYERLQSETVKNKFPGVACGNLAAVFEKSAGVLKADKCIQSLRDSIILNGGTIFDQEKVEKINPISSQRVEVITAKGLYKSKSIVLTCGSWINKLLHPLNLQLPVKPIRVDVCYWEAKNPRLFEASNNFPTTMLMPVAENHFYSTPIMEYPRLMKVCCHYGTEFDPDEPNRYDRDLARENLGKLTEAVKTYLPNLKPVPALMENCMYNVTPDHDFILDFHPLHRNIVIGAGFSGHGFKLSPAVGRILGDLALDKAPKFSLNKFSLSRFNVKPNL